MDTKSDTTLTFRERPARSDYSPVVKNVLNAIADAGSLILVGNALDDAGYAAFVATFAKDDGTTVIRESALSATAMRGAIDRGAKSLKRRVRFAPLDLHNGDDWVVVGYKVTETK